MKYLKELVEQIKTVLAKPGTYAAVKPIMSHAQVLHDFMHMHGVPNPEPVDSLHCTLLYSRKHLPDYQPDPHLKHVAYTSGIEVWPTKSGKRCLVLKIHSPSLQDRHKHLMDTHEATYDYPEYKTHISLSYDIGDFDHETLDISIISGELILSHEYHEELDTNGK